MTPPVKLPPGFSVELVASEETGLPKPVAIAFDDAGRMWSMTATAYPRNQDPDVWKNPGRDQVGVFDEPQKPGPQWARAFADGMVMPLSVLPHRNGAIVAQGPEMLFLDDTNGDGVADKRTVLLRGFGVQDTHTLPHQLEFAPGNWIISHKACSTTAPPSPRRASALISTRQWSPGCAQTARIWRWLARA